MNNRNSCPACRDNKPTPGFHKDGFDIWRCHKCRSMFVHNVPGAESLNAIYAESTYYDLPEASVERIQQENQRRLRILSGFGAYRTILDIGCAKGWLLDNAKALGFQTFGTELSAKNVEVCLQHGHKVVRGHAQDIINIIGDGFDVITCLDVIEHVEHPVEFLGALSKMLSKGGTLVVSTPNYSGVISNLLGHRDPYLIPPEHLNFFTRKGMNAIIDGCDLKIEKWTTFGVLTREERGRVFSKYFPGFPQPLASMINSMLPILFKALNYTRLGLEQEFYLSKNG